MKCNTCGAHRLAKQHGAGALAPDDIQAAGKNLIERYNDELNIEIFKEPLALS